MRAIYPVYVIAIYMLCILVVILCKGRTALLWDPVSLLMICGVAVSGMVVMNNPYEIFRSFAVAFEGVDAKEGELQKADVFFCTMRKLIYAAAFFVCLVQLFFMLIELDESSGIWIFSYSLAAALIPFMYAICADIMVALPFRAAVLKKISRG